MDEVWSDQERQFFHKICKEDLFSTEEAVTEAGRTDRYTFFAGVGYFRILIVRNLIPGITGVRIVITVEYLSLASPLSVGPEEIYFGAMSLLFAQAYQLLRVQGAKCETCRIVPLGNLKF